MLIYLHKPFLSMRCIHCQDKFEELPIQFLLNIVEGSTGLTNAEFKRFLIIANRSALEVVGCLYLAKRRTYISDEKFNELYSKIETLVKMIQALINSLNE